MPNETQHRDQFASNKKFYKELLGGSDATYSDWAVTALFYAALHKVDQYLYRLPTHIEPSDHQNRSTLIRTYCRPAWPKYKKLKDVSEQGRYMCLKFTKQELEKYEKDALETLPGLLK